MAEEHVLTRSHRAERSAFFHRHSDQEEQIRRFRIAVNATDSVNSPKANRSVLHIQGRVVPVAIAHLLSSVPSS